MIDTAMLLAAGFGTRMQPLSDSCPKPLLKLAGISLIDWTLNRLRRDGIKKFVINIHYLPDQMRAHFAAQNDVTLIHEDPILETGGGVKNALNVLGDNPFFVVNTDTIVTNGTEPVIAQMQQAWDGGHMDFLLLLQDRAHAFGYDGKGDFVLTDEDHVARRSKDDFAPYVFTGSQILNPKVFKDSPDGAFSLNLLYDKALEKGCLNAVVNQGGWYHIGTPEALSQAETIFLKDHMG